MLYPFHSTRKYLFSSVLLLSCIALFSLAGCRKATQETGCNCDLLQEGLQTNDADKVRTEINKLIPDLTPAPTSGDEYGQHDNLYVLADRISNQCHLTTTVLHYNGIETLPPQSELKTVFTLNGNTAYRVLDISYTPPKMLEFKGMHE